MSYQFGNDQYWNHWQQRYFAKLAFKRPEYLIWEEKYNQFASKRVILLIGTKQLIFNTSPAQI